MSEQSPKKTRTVRFAVNHDELPVLHSMLKKEAQTAKAEGASFIDSKGELDMPKMKAYISRNELVEGFLARVEEYNKTNNQQSQ